MVDRVGLFLVPATGEETLSSLARAAREAMYQGGEAWRGEARKLFAALDGAAVARRILEGEHALDASVAFEEQVARHAGRRWREMSPRERRQAVTDLLAKKRPALRKRAGDLPPEAFAQHVDAVSQLLREDAPATAGLWIQTDLADPAPAPDPVDEEPSDVSPEESLRLLREQQEQIRENDRRRGGAAETDFRLRLCHTTAKAAAEAHGLLSRARGNDDRFASARQDASVLLTDRAVACDESQSVGRIEAIRTLDSLLAGKAPGKHDSTGIYPPPQARALLDTVQQFESELVNAIPGAGAESVAWFVDSLRRAVAKRRAFAIVFDDTLL